MCIAPPDDPGVLDDLPADVEVLVWDGSEPAPAGLDRVQMLVPSYQGRTDPRVLTQLPNLKVVQLLSAGADQWVSRVPPGITLCTARGVHTNSTAELALAGLLAVLRRLPQFLQAQQAHDWQHSEGDELAGKRVLIVGAGDIGERVGAAVQVFDAEVTLVARRERPGVHTVAELPGLLPEHDIVVLALPLTPETTGLVDAAFLAAMPDGALLVNVARGPIVDTAALLAELRAERLWAFLDVVDPEPLPRDHPLWSAPNLILTPHVGGGSSGWERRAFRLVAAQLGRLERGEPLLNVVGAGY